MNSGGAAGVDRIVCNSWILHTKHLSTHSCSTRSEVQFRYFELTVKCII